ncbi:MAG TPA: hypothetical protein VLI45_09705 [Acidobacteriaceae bacterium]|nr:hypothetical protein [Acidobacteriaceae bacterium]
MHLWKFGKFVAWCGSALAGAAIVAGTSAAAQTTYQRHETNASRQARIQRTIKATYSQRWELFGGGGFLRFRSGEITQKNNEVTWAAEANYFLSPKLAVVADARGAFGNAKPVRGPFLTQAPHPQINEYTFTGGLNYRFYQREKLAMGIQGTGGVAWGNFSGGSKGLTYVQTGFWQDAFRPAFIGSFNLDYNVYPNLAFRVQPSYVGTTFTSPSGGSLQNNLGINAGIIYRFGRQ